MAGFAEALLPPHWVAGYPPSLPLWQVALHEAPLVRVRVRVRARG